MRIICTIFFDKGLKDQVLTWNILLSNPLKLGHLYIYSYSPQGYREEEGFQMHRNTSVCLTGPPLVPELQSPKTNKQKEIWCQKRKISKAISGE